MACGTSTVGAGACWGCGPPAAARGAVVARVDLMSLPYAVSPRGRPEGVMVADAVGSASPEGTGAVVDDPSCAVDGAGASVGVDTTAPGGVVETLGPGLAVRDRFRRGRDRPDGGPSAVPVPMSPGPEAAPAPSGDSTAGGSGASSSSDGAGLAAGASLVPGPVGTGSTSSGAAV